MNHRSGAWIIAVFFLLTAASNTSGSTSIGDIGDLPPGEQYRQLSLLVLISGGADPALLDSLAPPDTNDPGKTASSFNPDDYKTPLLRIVDQESMLRGAVRLFSFVQDNFTDLSAKLQSIKANNPVLISMVDTGLIMEDAIIIRNAIADSMVFLDYAQDEQMATLLGNYRVYTLFLRNQMEYAEYYEELEKITDAAVSATGGKMDAYQRMFDEEFESDAVDRYIKASEFSSEKRAQFDRRAAMLTEEIMQNVMDAQNPADP